MSIATQITRLKGLQTDLNDILVSKSLISSGQHTLEEDVEAVENFTPTTYQLQRKTVNLGASALSTAFPDSGYVGFSRVNLPVNSTYVNSQYIVSGNSILGVSGSASTVVNIRKVYWYIDVSSSSKTIVLNSANALCYPTGSFTPGSTLPGLSLADSTELLLIRTVSGGFDQGQNHANIIIKPMDYDATLAYLMNGKTGYSAFEYPSLSWSNNQTRLTITLTGTNDYFKGSYYVQIFY